jgi:SNF2 family DNA or RNA helicase
MGGWQGKQVVAYQNTEELAERFRSIAYECGADVVSLPETVDTTRAVQLGPKAARLYRDISRDFWAGVESGEVTASNALTRGLRLQQITGGSVGLDLGEGEYAKDRRVEHVDTAKQDALGEVLSDLPEGEPVVVFARFTADLDAIHSAAKAAGAESLELSGRRREHEAWQRGAASVLAVQMQAGGVGVDLTRARVCVYYSLSWSLGEYLQSRKRTHRPGQTRNVLYVHLVAEGTIDERVYRALEARQDVIAAVLTSGR